MCLKVRSLEETTNLWVLDEALHDLLVRTCCATRAFDLVVFRVHVPPNNSFVYWSYFALFTFNFIPISVGVIQMMLMMVKLAPAHP